MPPSHLGVLTWEGRAWLDLEDILLLLGADADALASKPQAGPQSQNKALGATRTCLDLAARSGELSDSRRIHHAMKALETRPIELGTTLLRMLDAGMKPSMRSQPGPLTPGPDLETDKVENPLEGGGLLAYGTLSDLDRTWIDSKLVVNHLMRRLDRAALELSYHSDQIPGEEYLNQYAQMQGTSWLASRFLRHLAPHSPEGRARQLLDWAQNLDEAAQVT